VATAGGNNLARPEDGDVAMPVTDDLCLAARGRTLPASDRRVLGAFAAYAAAALEQQRLTAEAQAAKPIAEADRMRAALLAAVSHDLRSPLASAKAAVTSLRSDDVQWSADDQAELLATADESLDKLTKLVENLLDMSRLQAGAMPVFPRPADLGEVVARGLDDLGPDGRSVLLEIPADLPEVLVNLSNTGSDRTQYLKVKVVLELPDALLMQQIQPVMPRITDTFQTYLRELRPTDLDGSAGLYRLKEELTRRVNIAIAPGKVNAVLFKEIVVQ